MLEIFAKLDKIQKALGNVDVQVMLLDDFKHEIRITVRWFKGSTYQYSRVYDINTLMSRDIQTNDMFIDEFIHRAMITNSIRSKDSRLYKCSRNNVIGTLVGVHPHDGACLILKHLTDHNDDDGVVYTEQSCLTAYVEDYEVN